MGRSRRWIVKIGSALVTGDGSGLDFGMLDRWSRQMAHITSHGRELVLVSSGAVAEGMRRLGWERRPHALHRLQAAAAVGQMGVVQAWESCFQRHGIHTAQILLTHDDLSDRKRYLNARTTLRTLLQLGTLPVVNENDTVVTDEIRFGDNDTLAALVANLVEAELLVILTDQEGMYERDPRRDSSARLLRQVAADDPRLDRMAGDSGALGRGGMRTKLRAARLAARSGTATIIASGHAPEVLSRIAAGEDIGTLLLPTRAPLAARKQWLAGQLQPAGQLHLDSGAVRAVRDQGRSLLAVGVTGVQGKFRRGELVSCLDADGNEVARGLVNYSAAETCSIKGLPSERFESVLGYLGEDELIHRDNLVLV
ncbi:MAG TPA: glutamate 5-kinase [Gammaproteobacteria bacterium]|nr:glutamate 5-kinase [Gammaproteobacteria bacterium]